MNRSRQLFDVPAETRPVFVEIWFSFIRSCKRGIESQERVDLYWRGPPIADLDLYGLLQTTHLYGLAPMSSFQLHRPVLLLALGLFCLTSAMGARAAERPNILIITIDDMNADSMGTFGCKLTDTTPNMDRLVKQGMRFDHAHVQVGNCMPSRNVMWSGLSTTESRGSTRSAMRSILIWWMS